MRGRREQDGESLLEKAVNVQVEVKKSTIIVLREQVEVKESTIIVLRDKSERTQRKDPKVSLHSS